MWCTVVFVFILHGYFGVHGKEIKPILKIERGLVRGSIQLSQNGNEFYAFEGIPYAKAPLGELRFQDPQPMDEWTGIWEATNHYTCMQLNHAANSSYQIDGFEDCLYINVYSPNIIDTDPLDVIVYIHGGAFMFGQGDFYGPNILMDNNVVFVNFNYRVGPLGFLSTEDEHLPGNYGLKDQVMALKWIQSNIRYFGGNPDSVTITGCSAGGASVHYHYLSPLSKGLFHRGISASGTALSNWALVEKPLEKTRKLASLVGCNQHSTKEMVACLRKRPGKQITQAVTHFLRWLYNPFTPFGPVVEKGSKNAFLSDLPYNLIKKNKVLDIPWIASCTKDEGLYPGAEFYTRENYISYLNKNWEEIIPHILHLNDTVSQKDMKIVAQKIRHHYFQDQEISKKTFAQLIQLLGDRLFNVDLEKAARLQANANKSPVYFYKFNYRGDHSISHYYAMDIVDLGVSHADDMFYVLYEGTNWFKKYMKSKSDKKMSKILTNIYTTFAKIGKPSLPKGDWTPVSSDLNEKFTYLNILSPDTLKLEKTEYLDNRDFWDSLPIAENEKTINLRDEL